MVSCVQALLLSLRLIFETLEQDKEIFEGNFYMTEHSRNPNSVEYKKWKLEKLDHSV